MKMRTYTYMDFNDLIGENVALLTRDKGIYSVFLLASVSNETLWLMDIDPFTGRPNERNRKISFDEVMYISPHRPLFGIDENGHLLGANSHSDLKVICIKSMQEKSWSNIRSLPEIQSITLDKESTYWPCCELSHLRKLSHLSAIHCCFTNADETLDLSSLSSIVSICFIGVRGMSATGLKSLIRLIPSLCYIEFSLLDIIVDDVLTPLNGSHVEHLVFYGCRNLAGDFLLDCDLPMLQTINIKRTPIKYDHIAAIARSKNMRSIVTSLDSDDVSRLSNQFPHIEFR